MSLYKIVKNAAGEVVCYGPNDSNYEPGIPSGCTLSIVDVLPPPTLAQTKLTQIDTFYAAYTAAIQLPVAYMATTFQADTDSQSTLDKMLSPGAVPTGFYWLDSANVKVTMTFVQAQGLALAMTTQGMTNFNKLQDKKVAVRDALTVAAVQLVTWL